MLAGLIDKGVLLDAEVMQQGEPSVAVTGESPVAPVTPLNACEVGHCLCQNSSRCQFLLICHRCL